MLSITTRTHGMPSSLKTAVHPIILLKICTGYIILAFRLLLVTEHSGTVLASIGNLAALILNRDRQPAGEPAPSVCSERW